MDQTIKPINSSSSEADHLVMLMGKHCNAAEQLALETVAGMDIPFLNPARELTKGECWQILEKQRDILKTVDQALMLSCLTDYITCASQNELFDTFRKKNDRNALPALLIRLDSQWVRFFHKLGQYDLTHAQLKSVVYLLRQSIKRLPEAYQKCFFFSALAMGESSLKKVEMPQRCSPVTFSGIVTTHRVTSPKETEKITQKQITSGHKADRKLQSCSVKHKNDARVLKAVAVNKTTSKGKQNHCDRPTDLRPAASKSAACTIKHTLDFVKPGQKVTVVDLRELTKGSLNSPVQKTQTKYSFDITKYIVKSGKKKPCTEVAECSKSLNVLLTEGKENQEIWPSSSPAGSDLVTTLKEPVVYATPQEKSSVVIDLDSPTKKPKIEGKEKVTNDRVNAFELMMERSRAGTRKNMKRRSLFQDVRKVV